jgi:uncharacterized protein YdaU (DUF1376 family)
MAKSKNPTSFLINAKEFSCRGDIESMSTEELGAYLLLMCKAWNERPPASVPDDDAILAKWARLTQAQWAQCRASVLSHFKKRQDGRLYDERLEREFQALRESQRRKSDAGRRAVNARWSQSAKKLKKVIVYVEE